MTRSARRRSWSATTSRNASASSTMSISSPTAGSSPRAGPRRCGAPARRSSGSSCAAKPTGRSRSTIRRRRTRPILPRRLPVTELRNWLERLGHGVTAKIWRLGFAARFFCYVLLHSGTALRRFGLTIREIYFAGVLSMVIILVSGLFVGMVLGLQGYDTLQRYGSGEALGVLVALSLVRELGPVVAGLLFASRAG